MTSRQRTSVRRDDADMAQLAADPAVRKWWALTDAIQEPLPERGAGSWWLTMPEIFRLD